MEEHKWKLWVAIAIVVFAYLPLLGQDQGSVKLDEEEESYGWANGVYYLHRDRQARVDLLHGMHQGISLLFGEGRISQEVYESYNLSGFRFGDFVDQIDKLYQDKANLRIPIAYAYLYALRRARGDSPQEIEEWLAAQRRRFLKRQ